MKNLKTSFACLAAAFLLAAGSFAQNPETLVTTPQGCSNSPTEQYYQASYPVNDSKVIALCNGLGDILQNIESQITSKTEKIGLAKFDSLWADYDTKIGDRLDCKSKFLHSTFIVPDVKQTESIYQSMALQFTSEGVTYKLFTSFAAENLEEESESLISANGEVIFNSKTQNGKTETSKKNVNTENLFFENITTYLATLGCTVEVVDAEASGSTQTEKQQYVCLRADREKFTANVKFEK